MVTNAYSEKKTKMLNTTKKNSASVNQLLFEIQLKLQEHFN